MSGIVHGWAYKFVKTGSGTTKGVLSALAEHSDPQGICWPSQRRLSDISEYNVSTIKRELKKLEKAGVIKVIRRRLGPRKTVNAYQIQIHLAFDLITGITQQIALIDGVTVNLLENNLSESDIIRDLLDAENIEGFSVNPLPVVEAGESGVDGVSVNCLTPSGSQPDTSHGLRLNPEPSGEPSNLLSNINTERNEYEYPPQSKVTVDAVWRPNSYIVTELRKKGIPEYFINDTLWLFVVNKKGKSAKQADFETRFCSWVISDWAKFKVRLEAEQAVPKLMTPDWVPNGIAVAELQAEGLTFAQIDDQLPEFRMYWLDQNQARASFSTLFVRSCRWRVSNGLVKQGRQS